MDSKYNLLFLGSLLSKHVITMAEKEDLENEINQFRRNEKLLSLLSRKSCKNFELFLDALDDSGQNHVADRIRGEYFSYFTAWPRCI